MYWYAYTLHNTSPFCDAGAAAAGGWSSVSIGSSSSTAPGANFSIIDAELTVKMPLGLMRTFTLKQKQVRTDQHHFLIKSLTWSF